MKRFLEGYFYSPTKGSLKLDKVVEELIGYIKEKPDRFYDIIVGCDSSSSETPDFPLVVVALRVGEGGRFFLKKIGYENRKFYNWRERILEEVLLSCDFALYLRENFEQKFKEYLASEKESLINPKNGKERYQFRYIHADVGENGKTKDMIKEVIGLIRGNGFEPKIKPESFVASTVADRYS
ncbi:MAG: ribonuclease H-like YkuK family protein [Candidatus Pacebacteria bacterium]|nr:ribonuclease H-like YkuK family protein [Candidatus Paceibacterota bacterium]